MKRLLWAAINSWHGIAAAARSEAAFWQELVLLAIGTPLAFWLTPQAGERLVLIGALVALLVVELLNTALEKLADRVTMERDDIVRRVKDMGSAAVGLTILLAIAVWAVIGWQRLGF
jgi:diacylglycerol kinase (ATP)